MTGTVYREFVTADYGTTVRLHVDHGVLHLQLEGGTISPNGLGFNNGTIHLTPDTIGQACDGITHWLTQPGEVRLRVEFTDWKNNTATFRPHVHAALLRIDLTGIRSGGVAYLNPDEASRLRDSLTAWRDGPGGNTTS